MDAYDDFVAARRSALIEEYGEGTAVEAAVDRALARCRRGWARLEQTTDVESHVRELISEELDRPRRRRLTIAAVAGLAVLALGAVLVSLLPAPPTVREEVNRVPVPWFADDELHLADVVVTLPGAGRFAVVDDGVVIEDAADDLLLVTEDGDVSDYDETLPDVPAPDVPSPYDADGVFSRRLDVVLAPGGESVHLMEIGVAGADDGTYVRLSETAKQMFVVCLVPNCTRLQRIAVPGGGVRLR